MDVTGVISELYSELQKIEEEIAWPGAIGCRENQGRGELYNRVGLGTGLRRARTRYHDREIRCYGGTAC